MLFRRPTLYALLVVFGLTSTLAVNDSAGQAGDDLYFFGFFQGQYRYSSQEGVIGEEEISSFSLQQLNAFLLKDFNPSFSAFVNVELTNTFATEQGWGSLRLEEAWARYSYGPQFALRAGLLVPVFNNLNEVKNRTPLLPYVFRPLAYETSFAGILNIENFAPQRAFFQINGALPAGQLRFDYAAYVGNNSEDFSATGGEATVASGTDLSMSKLVGGRLGLRFQGAKLGVSATRDSRYIEHDLAALLGQPAETLAQLGLPAAIEIGEVPRVRIGGDLSFDRSGVFGEAEITHIISRTDDVQDAQLAMASLLTEGALTDELSASFYYGMLGYNFSDRLFAYAMYNFIRDAGINSVQGAGLDVYSIGAGFRPIEGIVTKVQYLYTASRDNPLADFDSNNLYLGISVSF